MVPAARELSVALDETDRPRILARRIWYGYGAFLDKGHPRGGNTQQDYDAWVRHNRLGGSFRVQAGHAWQGIILANKKILGTSRVPGPGQGPNGQGEQLCVSNPAVRRLAIDYALANLKKRPEAEMTSMECSDGDGQCECDQCASLGSVSDRVFGLANEVAREVRKELPGRMVGLPRLQPTQRAALRYSSNRNLYVQLCAGFIRGPYSHEQLLELWPKKCERTWAFTSIFRSGSGISTAAGRQRGEPESTCRGCIPPHPRRRATSIDAESGNDWGVHGRGYYFAGRLMWNPDADVDWLYWPISTRRPLAPPPGHAGYSERVAGEDEPLLAAACLGEALRDVEEATRLARNRPDVLARLDQLKHYLYTSTCGGLSTTKRTRPGGKIPVWRRPHARLPHALRIHEPGRRWTHHVGRGFEQGLQQPGWQFNDRGSKPWIVATPVSREGDGRWFHEALEYFQPTPALEAEILRRPGARNVFRQPAGGALPAHAYQRPAHYALFSRDGEPLEVEITPGTIAWYRDGADARYRLRDAKQQGRGRGHLRSTANRTSYGSMCLGREPTFSSATIRVPAGGSRSSPVRPAACVNLRGRQSFCPWAKCRRCSFMFPRARAVTAVLLARRTAQRSWGPDRKAIQEVGASDEVISVAVPAGLDGRCWSLSPRMHQQLWFFDRPIAWPPPRELLLPQACCVGTGWGRKSISMTGRFCSLAALSGFSRAAR